MPKARLELDLNSARANATLRTVGRELRRMDNAKITAIFRRHLEDAARDYPRKVRLSVLSIPVKGEKHTGLRARIGQCAEVTSWTTGREAGVSVWINVQRMLPDYKTLPLYMDGAPGPSHRSYAKWRHPVYGRPEAEAAVRAHGRGWTWVTQEAHPYFSRAVEPLGAAAGAALEAALEDVTRQLSG